MFTNCRNAEIPEDPYPEDDQPEDATAAQCPSRKITESLEERFLKLT
jgi:hypothetical protein